MPSQPALLIHSCMFKATVQSWNLLQISFTRISAKMSSKIEWNVSVQLLPMHMDILTGHFQKTIDEALDCKQFSHLMPFIPRYDLKQAEKLWLQNPCSPLPRNCYKMEATVSSFLF